jgi:hypothetical protein
MQISSSEHAKISLLFVTYDSTIDINICERPPKGDSKMTINMDRVSMLANN